MQRYLALALLLFQSPFQLLSQLWADAALVSVAAVAAAVVAVTLARGRSAGGEVWETAVVRVGGMAEVVAEVAEVGVAEEADEDLVGADEGPVVAVGDTTTLDTTNHRYRRKAVQALGT